jgi:hypothetical protein
MWEFPGEAGAACVVLVIIVEVFFWQLLFLKSLTWFMH